MDDTVKNSVAKNFTFFAAGIDHASKRELEASKKENFH